jgi:hypothetical protein
MCCIIWLRIKKVGNKMDNTKVKEAENEVLDYLLDNWEVPTQK